MMNTPLSSTGQLTRYFLAGPLVVLAALGYSAAHARPAAPVQLAAPMPNLRSQPAYVGPDDTAGSVSLPAPERLTTAAVVVAAPRVAALPTSTARLGAARHAASTLLSGPTPLYYLDGQVVTEAQFKGLEPSTIANISVLKGAKARQLAGDKGKDGVVIITTKANENASSVVEFNGKVQRIAPIQPEAGSFSAGTLPADALYYLDGKPSTKQAVEQLDRESIADMDVVKEPARIHRIPGLSDSPATMVILITTKANVDSPAVLALADQADLASGYTFRPVGMNVLVPAALAYITSHYPNARLNEVTEQKRKTSGVVKYQVQLINGKRPFDVYFSPQGDFLGE